MNVSPYRLYTELCQSADSDRPRALDIFSGIGTFAFGMRKLCSTVGLCETNEFARRVLEKRIADGFFSEQCYLWTDTADITAETVTEKIGSVDVLSASITDANATSTTAIFERVLTIAKDLRAAYVLIENSRTTGDDRSGGDFFDYISALCKSGFDCRWTFFSSEYIGAPHRRRRLCCVARNSRAPSSRRLMVWDSLWVHGQRSISRKRWGDLRALQTSTRQMTERCQPTARTVIWPESGTAEQTTIFSAVFTNPPRQLFDNSLRNITLSGEGATVKRVQRWITPGQTLDTNSRARVHTLREQVMKNESCELCDTAELNPAWVECLLGIPPGWTDPTSSLLLVGQIEQTDYGIPGTFRGLDVFRRTVQTGEADETAKTDVCERLKTLDTAGIPFMSRYVFCMLMCNSANVCF